MPIGVANGEGEGEKRRGGVNNGDTLASASSLALLRHIVRGNDWE